MSPNLETVESVHKSKYDFTVWDHPLEAGRHIPLHWHDYLEFELIVSGQMEHVFNGRKSILEAGSAYLMCYNDFHELTALTDVHIYSLHFNKSLLPPEIAQYLDYNKFHYQFQEEETAQLEQLMKKVIREDEEKLSFHTLLIQNIITEIVVSMIRKACTNNMQASPLPIQQAVAYINEHFMEQFTLKELAQQLSFSTNYLGMLFKEKMNCTFNEYLNTLRLKYACSLLSSSDLTIKEISHASGYSSVEYFMYAFKKMMMITPKQYREEQKMNRT